MPINENLRNILGFDPETSEVMEEEQAPGVESPIEKRFRKYIARLGNQERLGGDYFPMTIAEQRIDARHFGRVSRNEDGDLVHRSYYALTRRGSFEKVASATFDQEEPNGLFKLVEVEIQGENRGQNLTVHLTDDEANSTFTQYDRWLFIFGEGGDRNIAFTKASRSRRQFLFDDVPSELPMFFERHVDETVQDRLIVGPSYDVDRIQKALTTPLLRTHPFEAFRSDDLKSWLGAGYQALLGINWNIANVPMGRHKK